MKNWWGLLTGDFGSDLARIYGACSDFKTDKMMIIVIECFIVCRLVFGGHYCLTPFTFLP